MNRSFVAGAATCLSALYALGWWSRRPKPGRTDLDLNVAEIASIMELKGWTVGNRLLTGDDVATQFEHLAATLDNVEQPQAYAQHSRFALIKHPDYESTYTACLVVGFVHRGEEAV